MSSFPNGSTNNVPQEEAEGSNAPVLASGQGTDMASTANLMWLAPNEVDRALAIKRMGQNSRDFKNVTDFEYAQYAIASQEETMEQVLHQMAMMQAFKEEYQIQDTVEQGVYLLNQMTLRFPGVVLAIEYLPSSRSYLSVHDFAAIIPSRITQSQEDLTIFFGAFYYLAQCKSTHMEVIRNGTTLLVECMGMSMENIDSDFFEKLMHEFYRWYPRIQKEQFFVNTPGAVLFIFGLWKRFFTKNMEESMHIDHKIPGMEGMRIDGLYKTPTPEAARQHNISRVQEYLQLRYSNQEQFRLPG